MSANAETPVAESGGGLSLRGREVVFPTVALAVVTAACWVWVVYDALRIGPDGRPICCAAARMATLGGAAAYLVSWGVMMTAMMLPTAAPMILMYHAGRRRLSQAGQQSIPTWLFTLVYIVVWMACGLPVYLGNLAIGKAARAWPPVLEWLPYAFGLTLAAAGVFQFTPLKNRCLHVCQHPMLFVIGHWRGGYRGTLRLALDHSLYCVVCCSALMVVLLAAGAMSMAWMLLITAAVSVEKIVPAGRWPAWTIGAALILVGAFILVRPDVAPMLQGPGM